MSILYESIRELESLRVRCDKLKHEAKANGEETTNLDNNIRLSLNQLPDRSQALTVLVQNATALKAIETELRFISDKIDLVCRQLKGFQKDTNSADTHTPAHVRTDEGARGDKKIETNDYNRIEIMRNKETDKSNNNSPEETVETETVTDMVTEEETTETEEETKEQDDDEKAVDK